jgi:hypothetical protein
LGFAAVPSFEKVCQGPNIMIFFNAHGTRGRLAGVNEEHFTGIDHDLIPMSGRLNDESCNFGATGRNREGQRLLQRLAPMPDKKLGTPGQTMVCCGASTGIQK